MRAEKARADAAGEPPQTHRRNRLGTPETPLSLEAQRELTGGDDIWQAAKCGMLTEARAPRRRRVHGIAKCSGRD